MLGDKMLTLSSVENLKLQCKTMLVPESSDVTSATFVKEYIQANDESYRSKLYFFHPIFRNFLRKFWLSEKNRGRVH